MLGLHCIDLSCFLRDIGTNMFVAVAYSWKHFSVMSSSSYLLLWGCCLIYLVASSVFPVVAGNEKNSDGHVTYVNKNLYYQDFTLDNPRTAEDIKLLGSAKFSKPKGSLQFPDESREADLRHQAGKAIYSSPIRVLDPLSQVPASFKTTFAFQFIKVSSNHNTSTKYESDVIDEAATGGSGLTFIIAPDEFTVGRAGPWLGMLNDACEDNYKAVAVEFDTRQNPEFGDPNDNHVGINLGSVVSNITVNASTAGVFLNDGLVHRAWITYDGPRRWLDIRLGKESRGYPLKPLFAGSLDISPFLKEYMFVGFSASTGNKTQIHYVYSWNFTSSSQASLHIPSADTCESKLIVKDEDGRSSKDPLGSYLIFAAVLILAFAVLGSLFITRKRFHQKSHGMDKSMRLRPPNKARRFASSEISTATQSFDEAEILGSDSRGVYYMGKLTNGCQVAVKRFSSQFLSSYGLEKRRLLKEIGSISKIRHPNLVPVKGWCHDKGEIMVVYDFYPNGSLDKWLFDTGALPWIRRLKIVKDIADALSFLHLKQLSHKNMKTSSIFLDVSFRASLGDYGFIRLANESRTYEAEVSQTADVFEFGIFLVEVVSGRRRLESKMSVEEKDLVDFAWRMHERDEKTKVVDKRISSVINMEQAIRVLEIGLLCTLNEDKGRPCMEEVVEFLRMEKPIPELPETRPMALFPYRSTTGLCSGYSCGSLMKPHF